MRVGVDIGATKIEFVVLDKKNKVILELQNQIKSKLKQILDV